MDENLIGIFSFVLAAATFLIGRFTATKNDGREEGQLTTDLQYIKEQLNKIDARMTGDLEALRGRIDELSAQQTNISAIASRAHESSRSAHRRLDEHYTKDHNINLVRDSSN